MNFLEIIDRLCAVTAAQADIIRQQAFVIENVLTLNKPKSTTGRRHAAQRR